MTKHDQTNIIREQMQANRRIIKVATNARTGQWASRPSLNERIKEFIPRGVTRTKSSRPSSKNK